MAYCFYWVQGYRHTVKLPKYNCWELKLLSNNKQDPLNHKSSMIVEVGVLGAQGMQGDEVRDLLH